MNTELSEYLLRMRDGLIYHAINALPLDKFVVGLHERWSHVCKYVSMDTLDRLRMPLATIATTNG